MQRTLRLGAMSVKTYANLSVPRTRWTLRVEPQQAGLTVRALLNKRLAYLGPDEVALAVEAGQVTATAAADPTGPTHPVTPEMIDDRLEYRQVLHVHIPAPPGLPNPADIPIEVLHDDGVLYAINKRPGLPVQPRSGALDLENILAALHARFRTDDPATDRVPHLAHRLDMDTSGVLLTLWDKKLTARVGRQFEGREVKKEYLAIVHGSPPEDSGTVDVPILGRSDNTEGELKSVSDIFLPVHAAIFDPIKSRHLAFSLLRYVPSSDGKEAQTGWRVEERLGRNFSLLRFFPHQGRTHQIRIHALWMGHPLLCDHMYGGGYAFTAEQLKALAEASPPTRLPISLAGSGRVEHDLSLSVNLEALSPPLAAAAETEGCTASYPELCRPPPESEEFFGRCALHNASLSLKHPTHGQPVTITAGIPSDMASVLELLRPYNRKETFQ